MQLIQNKISIGIPIFNCANTIERCIDSILNQTAFKNNKYEYLIVVVDDASTDNTFDILKKYPQIEIYRNPENKGVGITRKRTINFFTGEFATFIDADDYLEPDYLEVLLDEIIRRDADIACGGIIVKTDSEREHKLNPKTDNIPYLYTRIYRTKLLKKYPFYESRYSEDWPMVSILKNYARKIVNVENYGYINTYRKGSLTDSATYIENIIYGMLGYFYLNEFYKTHPDSNRNRIKTILKYKIKMIKQFTINQDDVKNILPDYNKLLKLIEQYDSENN